MLPILRILPVGGVLLAILILALALMPPDASRSPLTAAMAPARGALVDRERHPEVRQFLILAALKRADELNRLRDLPDTPTRSNDSQDAAKVAALPDNRPDTDPDDAANGVITDSPPVNIPVESGEPLVAALSPDPPEESRPTIKPAEPAKPRPRTAHRIRRAKAANAPQQQQFGLFDFLFSPPQHQYQRQAQTQAYAGRRAGQAYGASSQPFQTFRNNQVGQQPYVVRQPGQADQPASFAIPQIDSY